MKTIFTRKTIIIASIAILIAIITLVSINVFNSTGPVTGIANTVSRPLRALATQVARTFEQIYDSIYRYDALLVDYEKALRRLAEFERDHSEIIELREENEQLRAAQEFGSRYAGYKHVMASVVNRGGSNWSSSFTINRGYQNSEIQRGYGVATESGVLIGQVADVGAITSTVITIIDTTFKASATTGDRAGDVTAKGDFSLMHSGYLMLDHIDDSLIVLEGDLVVTSGAGAVFPAGLVLGVVNEVFMHSTGIGQYATVSPMRDVNTIHTVFVITDFDVTE